MSTIRVPVTEASQVGEARREAARLAERRDLGETAVGRVALVATELAGNLVKHATAGGELLLLPLDDSGVEILAVDRGPGMADVGRCLRDGYSTAGSPGTGLGAVSRLSDLFQVHSTPGEGTTILSRVWATPPRPDPEPRLEIGVVCRTKPGQEVCGDGWLSWRTEGRTRVLVVDGLGHGSGAAEASQEAVRVALEHAAAPPLEILERLHAALRPTRGAAVALAEVDPARERLAFVGIGNVSGSAWTGAGPRNLVSHNGIVGHELRRLQEFDQPWTRESVLVLHTDGLSTRSDPGRYPGLLSRHPSLTAGVLYRDYARESDDATVAVVRECPPR